MKTTLITLLFLCPFAAQAAEVDYALVIDEAPWSPDPAIRPVTALTVNGSLPGPTLRFRVGDTARIQVTNRLAREETSVHWHGILLPNAQDGVPHLTTPPIAPGATHTFTFPLTHAGTYWYHSHTGLQEQRGVYGSIVVEPRGGEPIRADRDVVVVLSDWTRERPEEVMRTLHRGSDWYAFRKGTFQSLAGAIRAGALADYLERERSRMPAMDISDVAYDAFLANGRPAIDLPAQPGETVRLRFINAGASTYFYLQSATGPLRIVAADGPAVRPLPVQRLLIGMAETYDVLVTVPGPGTWEIRATAQDGSGHATIRLGSGDPRHPAPEVPAPDPYRMDDHLMAALEESDPEPDAPEPERPLSPYARLRAVENTAFASHLPRREIELRLTGDMERYLWSFNDQTASEDGVIPIRRGEVLRLTLINDTMMHHPLHLHGHFFRVIDERERPDAPLKHTVDVPPMGTRVIEFEASESGDWLFHCHLLYHMHAGMARVFSYQEQGPDHVPDLGDHAHDPLHFMIDGSAQTHMTMGMAMARDSRNDYYAMWDIGYEDPHHVHYEIDLGWSRYIDPNLSAGFGARLTNHHDERDRAFAGIDYRLPYLVDSFVQVDSRGDFRIGLGKSIALTDRLGLFGGVHYDTGSEWEWTAGAEWLLTKQLSLISQYHSDHGFGGGLSFRF
ncbi:MAG: multicopper oxidase domain-containing protein [Verrucomicrobiales bacterium]|nr:multicopper oxidase domain-containing protein [Verrucomicrobiales bacterium]